MSLMLSTLAVVLLVAAAPVLTYLFGRRAGWPLAAGLLAIAAGLTSLYSSSEVVRESVSWIPAIDVAFRLRLDGLAFLFSLVILVIGAVVLIYSTSYLGEGRPIGFYTLMTAFAAAMLVLVLADDLVVMFIAWELTTLCSYLLILRSGPKAGPAATRTLFVTAAGGLCLLGAVTLTIVQTGTTNLTNALAHPIWSSDPVFAGIVAVLVAIAAFTKSAQFPFHAWLPDAMVAPAPVSAYLHAAAMVKSGIYLVMLFAIATSQSPIWSPLLIVIGLITAVMGALFALQRTDLKELLAYSTVSQLGLLIAVIGVGTPAAMLAASVHVIAHALFKSAGFMYVGLLERRMGSRDIRYLNGLARTMPWVSVMITLAAISMAGVAPTLGFVSKELVFYAMIQLPGPPFVGWLAALTATAGAILTVAYSARMIVTTLPGHAMEQRVRSGTGPMTLAVSLTAIGGILGGIFLWFLDDPARPSAAVAAGVELAQIAHLELWHGVNAALMLSLVAIAGGAVLTITRVRVDEIIRRPLFPISGVAAVQRIQDGIVANGRRVGDLTRTDAPAGHLVAPIVMLGLASVLAGLAWTTWPDTMNLEPIDIGLLVSLTIGMIAVLRARARLTAVIASGVVGFSVALWFFTLGASDVALTQLLVEILTVVVMVLVLRRLPRLFIQRESRRTLFSAMAAGAAGIAAMVATLVFTGHRPLSPAGEYFLAEAKNETGGTNVVNTILVDFRALDTMGELVVLAVAALALVTLMTARHIINTSDLTVKRTPLSSPGPNTVFLVVLDRALVPLMLIGSVYALLRGHNAPGGGFIAALLGASALGLAYLSASTDGTPRLNRPFLVIAASGILVAVGTGLLGLFDGSFLRPLHADVLGFHLTTALVFDVGVYLAVFGVILAALNLLGIAVPPGRSGRSTTPESGEAAPSEESVTS